MTLSANHGGAIPLLYEIALLCETISRRQLREYTWPLGLRGEENYMKWNHTHEKNCIETWWAVKECPERRFLEIRKTNQGNFEALICTPARRGQLSSRVKSKGIFLTLAEAKNCYN